MGASISKNADNSRQMEQMALQRAKEAEQSGQAVIEMVESMHKIQYHSWLYHPRIVRRRLRKSPNWSIMRWSVVGERCFGSFDS